MRLRFPKVVSAWLTGVTLLALCGPFAHSQDIFKRTTNPFVQFGGPGQPQVPWGSGAGAFNNNFWFNTLVPEQGVCVWVTNNNTTFAHSFSLVVSSTGNPNVGGFTGFTGQWTSTSNAAGTSFPFSLSPASTTTFFFAARSSAFMNLGFSGSTNFGGTDTATITAVLTNAANCSAVVLGNTVIGPTPAGNTIASQNNNPLVVGGKQNSAGTEVNTAKFVDVDSFTNGFLVGGVATWNEASGGWTTGQLNNANNGGPQLMFNLAGGFQSDVPPGAGSGDTMASARMSKAYGLMTTNPWAWGSTQEAGGSQQPLMSFQTQKDVVNPAAGALLLSVNINNATNQGFTPYRVTVSCSAACDYTINRVSNAGTTCASTTVVKAFDPGISGASLYIGGSTGGCVANPTITQTLYHIFLPAAGSNTIDMTGYWWARSSAVGVGFDVQEGAAVAAGTVSTTIEVVQRGGNQ